VVESHSPEPGMHAALTPREIEILEMAARGLTNDEMAKQLEISVHGVKFHLASIYRKLGVHNRTEAAVHYMVSGETNGLPAESERV
jgi:DNA-binding CsgD family transcriptional regulator